MLGLVLRGVCLMRPQEIQWMYGGGAGACRAADLAASWLLPARACVLPVHLAATANVVGAHAAAAAAASALAAGSLRPLAWARFLEHLSPAERATPLLSYYQRLLSNDARVRAAAVRAVRLAFWSRGSAASCVLAWSLLCVMLRACACTFWAGEDH